MNAKETVMEIINAQTGSFATSEKQVMKKFQDVLAEEMTVTLRTTAFDQPQTLQQIQPHQQVRHRCQRLLSQRLSQLMSRRLFQLSSRRLCRPMSLRRYQLLLSRRLCQRMSLRLCLRLPAQQLDRQFRLYRRMPVTYQKSNLSSGTQETCL